MPHLAYLSLGSNIGDREANLREARERLGRLGFVSVRKISSFYQTEPVEVTDQPWFLNCAIELETKGSPQELMRAILGIEKKMGRKRVREKGPRIIDIDILLFGDERVDSKNLRIPHPAMQERRFVLEPLSEIAAELRHPVMNKTIGELLASLPPGQIVCRLKG